MQADAGATPLVKKTGGSLYLDDLLATTQGAARGVLRKLASQGQFLATLPSIRWTHEQAIFLGPMVPNR